MMDDAPDLSLPSLDISRQLYSGLVRTMAYLHHGLNPRDAWQGLPKEPSFAQFKALMMLRHMGPSTLKDLAVALGISAASASEMVERLVELDLLDRRPDTRDRRRVQVTLTARAEKGLRRHEALVYRRLADLMDAMGPRDARRWVEVFCHLGSILESRQTHHADEKKPEDA